MDAADKKRDELTASLHAITTDFMRRERSLEAINMAAQSLMHLFVHLMRSSFVPVNDFREVMESVIEDYEHQDGVSMIIDEFKDYLKQKGKI